MKGHESDGSKRKGTHVSSHVYYNSLCCIQCVGMDILLQKAKVERRGSVNSMHSVNSGRSITLKKPAEVVMDKNGTQYAILPSPHLQQVMIFKNGEMVPLDLLAG